MQHDVLGYQTHLLGGMHLQHAAMRWNRIEKDIWWIPIRAASFGADLLKLKKNKGGQNELW